MITRDFALWTGILAGPVVWLISFELNFLLAPWACVFEDKLPLYIISIVALIISAASGSLAWREWKALGINPGDEDATGIPRARVMAVSGVLLSAMFFLVILAQAIPEIVLGACQ